MANNSSTKWMLGTASAASGMVTLPEPDLGSVDRTLNTVGGTHVSITGSQTRDTFGMKYSWTLAWSMVDPRPASGIYATVMQFWVPDIASYKGVGPFYFNDPQLPRIPQVNVLSVSEASKALGSSSITMTLSEV